MPMYNLKEYSGTYSKTSESLQQYYRDGLALEHNNIIDFPANNNTSISCNLQQQKTGQTKNGGTKDVKIMVQLKYRSNFGKTLQIPLINSKISLELKWSKDCFLAAGTAENQEPKFGIIDTKRYVHKFINLR